MSRPDASLDSHGRRCAYMCMRGPVLLVISTHRTSFLRNLSCSPSSVGQWRTTKSLPSGTAGLRPQKLMTPCCLANAMKLIASTMLRGSGSPREPGAGYRSYGTSYAAAAASTCESTRASLRVAGRPMHSGSAK